MAVDDLRLAKELRIVMCPNLGAGRLYIDGELFPYFTVDGFTTHLRRAQPRGVTLTIAAESVVVIEDDSNSDRHAPPPRQPEDV